MMSSSHLISVYVFCFITIFLKTWISKGYRSNRLFDRDGIFAGKRGKLITLNIAGILCFGLLPLSLFNSSHPITGSGYPTLPWLLSFAFFIILIVITGFIKSRRIQIWYEAFPSGINRFLLCYFPLRILFLCSYELFFRGFLLADCIKWIGLLPAIAFSTSVTVLMHAFNDKRERWACIPFGIILSSTNIAFHAIWPAVVLHLALSLSYEIPPLYKLSVGLKPVN